MAGQRFRVPCRHDPLKRIDSILVASSTAIAFVQRGYYAVTGRFDLLRVNASPIVFNYDGKGQRTKTVWGGGVERREYYNTNHERYRTSFPSHCTVDAALWQNYSYDKLERRSALMVTSGGATTARVRSRGERTAAASWWRALQSKSLAAQPATRWARDSRRADPGLP